MSLLCDLANKYRTDKGTQGEGYHGFTPFYAKFWESIRFKISSVLEIGINNGRAKTMGHAASQRAFQDYFPNAIIYGADIDNTVLFNEGRIITFLADQTDEKGFLEQLSKFAHGRDSFDIIIDDGSHDIIHQQTTLGFLFPKVSLGGWYVVEDLHTSNWNWGFPPRHPDTTLSVLQRLATKQPMNSKYMKPEQVTTIEQETEFCEIFEHGPNHITSMIKRR